MTIGVARDRKTRISIARLAFWPLLSVFGGFFADICGANAELRTPTFTIVHVADLANIVPADGGDRPDMRARGGIARVVAVIDAVKGASSKVLVTHAGGAISPSPYSLLDEGAHMIDILNRVGFDVMAAGSHEFDFGPDVAERRFGEARFPILVANARRTSGAPLAATRASFMLEVDGLPVGVVGGVTASTAYSSRPGDVAFADPVTAISEEAGALRDAGARFVIALAGLDADEDRRLLETQSVDLILGGGDERLRALRTGDSYLVETDARGGTVAVVEIFADVIEREIVSDERIGIGAADDARRIDETAEWFFDLARIETEYRFSFGVRFVDTINVAPEVFTEAVVQQYATRFHRSLAGALGVTSTPLDTRASEVRSRETAFGNMLADAMRSVATADIALVNGGAVRGDRIYAAGSPLTLGAVFAELPFDNRVVVRLLSGSQLLSALQHSLDHDDGPVARFLQVSGLEIRCGAGGSGSRIRAVEIGGAPLETARFYRVAMTDFLADGGDGYAMLADGTVPADTLNLPRLADVLAGFLRNGTPVAPTVEGRINCP